MKALSIGFKQLFSKVAFISNSKLYCSSQRALHKPWICQLLLQRTPVPQHGSNLFCIRNLCSSVKDDLQISTVQILCQYWTRKFEENDVPEPEVSAEFIIAHVLGEKMIHEVKEDLVVEPHLVLKIDQFCQQRMRRVPVQYIIGEWDFHDLALKMKEPVFIPRPETEELAALVCNHINKNIANDGKFLEIGCGSGAISLYLLKNCTQMTGVAVDKHFHACDLTLENANTLGLNKRLEIHQVDIFSKDILSDLRQYAPFDVIISNPPYIPTHVLDSLEPEIIKYECSDALDGGEDGLDVVRQILLLAPKLLNKGGYIWLEVDLGEPELIQSLVKFEDSLRYVKTLKDFTERDRFCVLQVV